MRALMLFALFDGLGAREVTSGAFADNPASQAVSHRVGYLPNGATRVARGGQPTAHTNYLMTAERFEQMREANMVLLGGDFELEGFERLRSALTAS